MSGYSRRRLLAVGTAVSAGTVAGCLGNGETTAGTGTTPAGDGPVLETITLENLNSRSHTLNIIIQRNDEIEYWEEHELSAVGDSGSSLLLDSAWPAAAGEFQLTVRLDDGTPERFASSDLPDRDCLNLVVLISREGELSILTDVSGGACVDADDAEENDVDE